MFFAHDFMCFTINGNYFQIDHHFMPPQTHDSQENIFWKIFYANTNRALVLFVVNYDLVFAASISS
jgi:hypothetical protein